MKFSSATVASFMLLFLSADAYSSDVSSLETRDAEPKQLQKFHPKISPQIAIAKREAEARHGKNRIQSREAGGKHRFHSRDAEAKGKNRFHTRDAEAKGKNRFHRRDAEARHGKNRMQAREAGGKHRFHSRDASPKGKNRFHSRDAEARNVRIPGKINFKRDVLDTEVDEYIFARDLDADWEVLGDVLQLRDAGRLKTTMGVVKHPRDYIPSGDDVDDVLVLRDAFQTSFKPRIGMVRHQTREILEEEL